jgi:hypothetical protein
MSYLRIGLFDLSVWDEPSNDGAYDVRPGASDPLGRTPPVRRARQLEDLGPLELGRGAELPLDLVPVSKFLNDGPAGDCYVLPIRRFHFCTIHPSSATVPPTRRVVRSSNRSRGVSVHRLYR